MWPTLQSVIDLGGSASNSEIAEAVSDRVDLAPEVLEQLHGDGPLLEVDYRVRWAQSYLKGMGLLHNSTRGIWSVTDLGQQVDEADIRKLHAEYLRKRTNATWHLPTHKDDETDTLDDEIDQAETEAEDTWKNELLDTLIALSPAGFEKLVQRLLREAGVHDPAVTGRSGDRGIDGTGVYKMGLVSFPVFFQCKRYSGSVGPEAVRDFRGAMEGRGDKGLLITTGTFTKEARREATRDGAKLVDVIDGNELCDLLKIYGLGVTATQRVVEAVKVNPGFFTQFDPKPGT